MEDGSPFTIFRAIKCSLDTGHFEIHFHFLKKINKEGKETEILNFRHIIKVRTGVTKDLKGCALLKKKLHFAQKKETSPN